jgi:hypothetical protein
MEHLEQLWSTDGALWSSYGALVFVLNLLCRTAVDVMLLLLQLLKSARSFSVCCCAFS